MKLQINILVPSTEFPGVDIADTLRLLADSLEGMEYSDIQEITKQKIHAGPCIKTLQVIK